jgi:hypothetical protein
MDQPEDMYDPTHYKMGIHDKGLDEKAMQAGRVP